MEQEYKEIDLLDLFYAILSKWKLLIIVTVIFALLGTGLGFIKANQAKTPTTKSDLAALEATMTEEEISDVKSAASIINEYRNMYNSQKSYNENSIYQNLDPFDIKTATLKYYVDNNYVVSYPVISEVNNLVPIVQTYISVLNKDDIYERMTEEIDSSVIPLYFSEMVSVETENIQDNGMFVVTVMADTNEHLDRMVAIVKDELESSSESISETYGTHTLTLAFESVQSEAISEVYDQQQKNIEKLTTITTAITTTESAFSGDQLTYLKGLVHEELEEEVSVVKYVVIGALIGLLLVIVVEIVKYLLSGTVKNPKELEKTFEVLGVVSKDSNNGTKFDRWIERRRVGNAADASFDIINTKLEIITKKQTIKDVCFIADGDFIVDIEKEIKVRGVKILMVSDIENNADSLKALADASAIVLVEKLNVSKTKNLEYAVNHAKQYDVPVIGTVVLA